MIKTVVTDVDGVLTTGRFFYDNTGKALKEFGPHDSDGVKLLRASGINVVAITADHRGHAITRRRLDDMEVELLFITENLRLTQLKARFAQDETLFIGDGYHDAPALRWFSASCAPANACPTALQAAKHVLTTTGGNGVLLEVALLLTRDRSLRLLSYESILSELQALAPNTEEYRHTVKFLCDHIFEDQVIGIAAGRMGFVLRAFIMRLAHLGVRAVMLGDPGTLVCNERTTVIINSSSGETPSVTLFARQARAAGARIVLITATPDSSLGILADVVLSYPKVESQQPMKTLYEQFTFLLFDAIVADIMDAQHFTHGDVSARHSNLE